LLLLSVLAPSPVSACVPFLLLPVFLAYYCLSLTRVTARPAGGDGSGLPALSRRQPLLEFVN